MLPGVHTFSLGHLPGRRDDNQGEKNENESASDTKSPRCVKKLKQVETGNRFLGVVHARDYRWAENPKFLFLPESKHFCDFKNPPHPSPDGQLARATGWARRRRCWTSTCSQTRRKTTTAESSSTRSRRSAVSLLRWLFAKQICIHKKPQFGMKSDVKQSRFNLTLGSDVVEASF